jgi:hypothetical protein
MRRTSRVRSVEGGAAAARDEGSAAAADDALAAAARDEGSAAAAEDAVGAAGRDDVAAGFGVRVSRGTVSTAYAHR